MALLTSKKCSIAYGTQLGGETRGNKIDKKIIGSKENLYENCGKGRGHPKLLVQVNSRSSTWLHPVPLFLQHLPRQLMSDALEGFEDAVKVNGRVVTDLRFADDIDLVGENEAELRDLTERLHKTATNNGMEIRGDQSKILITFTDNRTLSADIKIDDEKVKEVNSLIIWIA